MPVHRCFCCLPTLSCDLYSMKILSAFFRELLSKEFTQHLKWEGVNIVSLWGTQSAKSKLVTCAGLKIPSAALSILVNFTQPNSGSSVLLQTAPLVAQLIFLYSFQDTIQQTILKGQIVNIFDFVDQMTICRNYLTLLLQCYKVLHK